MNPNKDCNREEQIQKYTGVPNKLDKKEITLWTKFIRTILPWITRKWELGNDYLEARVAKEVNEAEKIKAETTLLKIQAEKNFREIIDKAETADVANSKIYTDKKSFSESDLEEDIENLKSTIRMMRLKYGTKMIMFSIEEEQNNNTL